MIQTASFFTYPSTGPGRISIARHAPRGYPKGYRTYSKLAPGEWFNRVTYSEYRRLYFAQLSKLDPEAVVKDLYALVGVGINPVLLCYERPPFDAVRNYCHRRMAAEWLENKLGLEIPEWSGQRESNPQPQLEP